MKLSTLIEVLMVVCLFAGTVKAQGVQPMPPPMLPPPMLEGNAQPVVLVDGNYQSSQTMQSLPVPVVEETYLPQLYYNLDFALVQPRFRGTSIEGGPSFSPNMDWTVMPRFEVGLMNRGSWNFYFGYQGIYSDSGTAVYDNNSNTLYSFSHSSELDAFDFGFLSETFPLLSVIRAQWDVSARLTIADFHDRFGLDFTSTLPSYFIAHYRQQFVGAGPRAGMRLELPFRDTGLSLTGRFDGGIQWGTYQTSIDTASNIDNDFHQDSESMSKGGVIWHVGGQLALRYSPLRYADRLSFSAGYLYEAWFSKDVGLIDGNEFGRFDYHGPFFRMEWRY